MIERTNTASLTLTGGKELKESFCPLHREHFKEHYATRVPQLEMPPKRAQPENFPHSENVKVTVNEDPPTLEEMQHVLKTFKNNKSDGTDKRKTEGLKLLRQMVNGGRSRLPTPEDAEDTEFRLRCTKTDILHITNKQSQKCDLEPIFKILVMFDV